MSHRRNEQSSHSKIRPGKRNQSPHRGTCKSTCPGAARPCADDCYPRVPSCISSCIGCSTDQHEHQGRTEHIPHQGRTEHTTHQGRTEHIPHQDGTEHIPHQESVTQEPTASCSPTSPCQIPIVITTPSDHSCQKTNLRIELYIHQIPAVQTIQHIPAIEPMKTPSSIILDSSERISRAKEEMSLIPTDTHQKKVTHPLTVSHIGEEFDTRHRKSSRPSRDYQVESISQTPYQMSGFETSASAYLKNSKGHSRPPSITDDLHHPESTHHSTVHSHPASTIDDHYEHHHPHSLAASHHHEHSTVHDSHPPTIVDDLAELTHTAHSSVPHHIHNSTVHSHPPTNLDDLQHPTPTNYSHLSESHERSTPPSVSHQHHTSTPHNIDDFQEHTHTRPTHLHGSHEKSPTSSLPHHVDNSTVHSHIPTISERLQEHTHPNHSHFSRYQEKSPPSSGSASLRNSKAHRRPPSVVEDSHIRTSQDKSTGTEEDRRSI